MHLKMPSGKWLQYVKKFQASQLIVLAAFTPCMLVHVLGSFWLFHIQMPYNIILYFRLPFFISLIVLYFLHSTSVFSFYIELRPDDVTSHPICIRNYRTSGVIDIWTWPFFILHSIYDAPEQRIQCSTPSTLHDVRVPFLLPVRGLFYWHG